MNMQELRNTGRTARMLAEALDVAAGGGFVVVASRTCRHSEELRQRFLRMLVGKEIKVDKVTQDSVAIGEGRVNFSSMHSDLFDWRTLRFRGLHPNTKQFIDHAAIEAEFGPALEMLHRWDAKPPLMFVTDPDCIKMVPQN